MRRLPLAGHPSISTSSLDEAQSVFAQLATPIRIESLDRRNSFRWLGHRVRVGSVVLAAQEYGGAFRATSEDTAASFTASFPLTDVAGEARAGGVAVDIARGRSTFLGSPSGPRAFSFGNAYRGLQFIIDEREMIAMVLALTGGTPKGRIQFEPRMALDSGVGASLDRLVRFIVAEVDEGGPLVESPLVGTRFADTLVANLLVGHPHNARQLFDAKAHAGEPRHVRVATEFLDANAGKPIRMADLARAAGVSIRSLQAAFSKHRGSTPMEFLRERRLERAHQLLSIDEPKAVNEVALECGFTHLGRFSAWYYARFGEHPSATRARGR
ncbi:Transcriptional regulator, AraC family [Labilithrix luteola]|uniref:Transcriptional regulator, AraC family n=1 Tax=Labilithrix luteola TaxID=1391654 RepID=A0A0K1PPJ4_9BACT|nr:AraC family transcriptional regulator [Labilithrix luteola]AKU95301.1 Transcriptional regulator, AraC family [Labilithrix luteola]